MLRKYLVATILLFSLGWFFLPVFAFHSPETVTSWISLLSPKIQRSYIFALLLNKDEADYKKAVLLEAWLNDMKMPERKFKLDDVSRLVPVTAMGGEALSEPIGLTAARIIIDSKNCEAIGQLFAFYRLNEIATLELKKRLISGNVGFCENISGKNN